MGMQIARGVGRRGRDLGVKIEAQFTVGEYEVLILSASDSMGLDTWLRREKYNIPAGAEPNLATVRTERNEVLRRQSRRGRR